MAWRTPRLGRRLIQVILPLATILCLVSVKYAEPAPRNMNSEDLVMETAALSTENARRHSSWEMQEAADENSTPLYRPLCKTDYKVHTTYEAFKMPKYEFVPETFKSTWCVKDKGKQGICNNGYGHCVTQHESREFARRLKGSPACQPWEKIQLNVAAGCNCLAQI